MGKVYQVDKCPVFLEDGDIHLTVPFGENIKDYPTDGQTGDHFANDITRWANNRSTTATIVAIADGVIYAQRKWVQGFQESPAFGNCVYIRHEDGTVTKYAHLAYGSIPDWIKDNVPVKKGDILGAMGSTGYSHGAHLHFQMEDADGNRIDPLPYLLGEKVIGETPRYFVNLTKIYDDKETAQEIADALTTLGIDAEVSEVIV